MSHEYSTPEACETAFYNAFAAGDLAALMRTWADSSDAVCIHPLGAPLAGTRAVHAGWSAVLAGGTGLQFRCVDICWQRESGIAVHVLFEYITVPGEGGERSPMIATNAMRLTADGWRMVLHHASPAAPGSTQPAPAGATRH